MENTVLFASWDHEHNLEQIVYEDEGGEFQAIFCYTSKRHGVFYVDAEGNYSTNLGIGYVQDKPVTCTYYSHPDFDSQINWYKNTEHQYYDKIAELPEDFDLEDILMLVSYERPEWCDICKDYMRTESYAAGGNGCAHVHWCDECGGWYGPGSEDGDCDHIHKARECPNRSKRREEEHTHIYDWELIPDPIMTFCLACGQKSVMSGPQETIDSYISHDPRFKRHLRCQWCGAIQSEYMFLKEMIGISRGTKISLPCRQKDCIGHIDITVADFVPDIGVAGNGPYCYSVANRWGLKRATCNICQKSWDGYEESFLRYYREQLQAFVKNALVASSNV